MPFATESAVRARFQMDDTELVPPAMVAAAIDAAHLEITRRLAPGVETDPPEEGLVLGETVLAGARVYELLAGADAVAARRLRLGSVTAHEGERRVALLAVAALAEKQAWYVLEPYVDDPPPVAPLGVSDSAPVLGEAAP